MQVTIHDFALARCRLLPFRVGEERLLRAERIHHRRGGGWRRSHFHGVIPAIDSDDAPDAGGGEARIPGLDDRGAIHERSQAVALHAEFEQHGVAGLERLRRA